MSKTESGRVSVDRLPLGMLLEHRDTISAMALGGLRSVLPLRREQETSLLQRIVKAPSQQLLSAYRNWCQAADSKGIPPHLVCAKLAMPMVADLSTQAPYPMLGVLNQGVRLDILQPIPEGEDLLLQGELLEASDDGYRARIHSRIQVGTASVPHAMNLDAIMAVVLKQRPAGPTPERAPEPEYETVASWEAAWNEGQTFFWLTGDFNPIHTLPWLARRTRFKGCIMHGYGAFAQVYEALRRSGSEIHFIETRFVRPLPLPSGKLLIQRAKQADSNGNLWFRLVGEDGTQYQAGVFR